MQHNLEPMRSLSQVHNLSFRKIVPHLYCDAWSEMRSFLEPETNLAVLKREVPSCPESIRELLGHLRSSAQTAFDRGMDLEMIPALLDEDLDLKAEDSFHLYSDIAELAHNFMELTGALRIGVRLERVETDNCRLFHVDHVEARLVTTYSGAGTEWLRNVDVKRSGLGQGDNDLVMKPGARIQAMKAGWVGIMKGERKNHGAGLVHRSPPIELAGLNRILLPIDVLT